MGEKADTLSRARRAHASHDWIAAAAQFDRVELSHFGADDLAAYADALWWVGRAEDNLRVQAAACDALLAESRSSEAAWAAVLLGIFHLGRGDEPQGIGWIGRAGRILEGVPECPAHGLLLQLTEVEPSLRAGQPAAAIDAARRLRSLGHRIGDPGTVLLGLHCEGRARITAGEVDSGLMLLDEVMVTALGGRLTPFLAGSLYCHTIATCHEVSELHRMARWTDLTEEWLSGLTAVGVFRGLCAVHRAQLLVLQGSWDEAERTALDVAGALDTMRVDYAAEAWYVVGDSRRLRGDPTSAEAYDEARARGKDPQPGLALLRLGQGDVEGAAASMRTALTAAGHEPLRRTALCAAAVHVAVADGRVHDARAAASELEATASTYPTSGLRAMAAGALGAVLVAENSAAAALPVLRDACRRWHELGAMYEVAHCCLLLATAYRALGDEASAKAEEGKAEGLFGRLGVHRPAGPPAGLTDRECEVLALVADGRSNREIGETLFISDRTVARHLTNIFHKLDVSSRTQAARYALDQGLKVRR